MKMTKKIAVLTAAVILSSSLFAQTSSKSSSTAGLFGGDVDNFLSVVNWDLVKPENMFGFLGYMTSDTNCNFGLAHNFDSFYGATYFSGRFDGFDASTSKTVSGDDVSKIDILKNEHNGAFTFAALAGIGNMGVKVSLFYSPSAIDKTDSKYNDKSAVNYAENFRIRPTVTVGLKDSADGKTTKITGGAYLNCDVNKTTTKTLLDDTTNKSDNSEYTLRAFGSYGVDTVKNENLTTSFGVSGSADFVFPGVDDTNKKHGEFYNTIYVTPSYTVSYKATDKLNLKASASALLSFDNEWDYKYKTDKDGNKTYNTARNEGVTIELDPALNVAGVYQIKPDFSFNMGASFFVPYGSVSFGDVKTYDNNGEVTSKTTESSIDFNTASGSISWDSGFTWNIGKVVTLDCMWDIIDAAFGNMKTSFNSQASTTNGSDVFFMNLNNIFFTNVTVQVSVKF